MLKELSEVNYSNINKLVMGCAQLGADYGVTNKIGNLSNDEANLLLKHAYKSRIRVFDTAQAYGDSEARIGRFLETLPEEEKQNIEVITKLYISPDDEKNLSDISLLRLVECNIDNSLQNLKSESLDILLLHRPHYRIMRDGLIWNRLKYFVDKGKIGKIGLSVNEPKELFDVLSDGYVKHIQLPINILDMRWKREGVDSILLANEDVSVHVRSVFLQGILVQNDTEKWPDITGVDNNAIYNNLMKAKSIFNKKSLAELCVSYVNSLEWVNAIVIGIESNKQIDDNIKLMQTSLMSDKQIDDIHDMFSGISDDLLMPSRW